MNAMKDGYVYRLPTEAEWEYACRVGDTVRHEENLDAMAWYDKNSESHTHEAGEKQPNDWGLYDMYGNMWEWCQDRYDRNYYRQRLSIDPQGPASGAHRVIRGGSWSSSVALLRARHRDAEPPDYRSPTIGFRLVRTPR